LWGFNILNSYKVNFYKEVREWHDQLYYLLVSGQT